MSVELVRCVDGNKWFPWNYGRTTDSGRVRMSTYSPAPGYFVFNAVEGTRVLGSCALRVGYRHSEQILGDEEYQYGAASAGPAYFWPDDDKSPWICVLKSFWVRPEARQQGIARMFAEHTRSLGLPTYLAFANTHMEAFFDRHYNPTKDLSSLQQKISVALDAYAGEDDEDLGDDADFTVYVQAQVSAGLLYRCWQGGDDATGLLSEALVTPSRAGMWEIDSGEIFEAGFSDSALAYDRSYGYTLAPWLDDWGPQASPYDHLDESASDEDYRRAALAHDQLVASCAGSLEGWVFDPIAVCAYASVRRFLRTLDLIAFDDINAALVELFEVDLAVMGRGLANYSALVSPSDGHPGRGI